MEFAHIEGLQLWDASTGSSNNGMEFWPGDGVARASHNLLRGNSGNPGQSVGLMFAGDFDGDAHFWNNVLYDWTHQCIYDNSVGSSSGAVSIYNNTLYGCPTAVLQNLKTVVAKNNIAQGVTTLCFDGAFAAASDYNVCNRSETLLGSHSKNSAIVSFVGAGSGYFSLAPGDTVARGAGDNLWGDAEQPVSDNVVSAPRAPPWNIGAF